MVSSSVLEHTPIEDIVEAHDTTRKTFFTRKTRSLDYRKQQLGKLNELLAENMAALCGAVNADLAKHPHGWFFFFFILMVIPYDHFLIVYSLS